MSKTDPLVAASRKELAAVYRNLRKESHLQARIFKRAYDATYKKVAADFHRLVYETGTGAGDGLSGLFE